MASLEELLAVAANASAPSIVDESGVQVGGVDPLGLRQINFDLMDKVLPGLNNVANRLRPFILMTWAWRRVRTIIERDKLGGATDKQMRDFVDRIEAIYSWSQFLLDTDAGIPGGQALADLIYEQLRALDYAWTTDLGHDSKLIYVLMPLTPERGSAAYRERMTLLLNERFGVDVAESGLVFHQRNVDGKQSAANLVAGIRRQAEQHAPA